MKNEYIEFAKIGLHTIFNGRIWSLRRLDLIDLVKAMFHTVNLYMQKILYVHTFVHLGQRALADRERENVNNYITRR